MFTPNRGKYGYGVYISSLKSDTSQPTTVIGHNGSISGFSSSMLHYCEEDILVILLDNTRAEKRSNLENITVGIVNLLHQKPVRPIESMQVAMIERMKTGNGEELVNFYLTIKAKKTEYALSGADLFLHNLGEYLQNQGRLKDAEAVLKMLTENGSIYGACVYPSKEYP